MHILEEEHISASVIPKVIFQVLKEVFELQELG